MRDLREASEMWMGRHILICAGPASNMLVKAMAMIPFLLFTEPCNAIIPTNCLEVEGNPVAP